MPNRTRRSSIGAVAGARLAAPLALAGLVGLAPGRATAGGFEIPDSGARAVGRGGAYVVGAADPTALYYNPGLLAKQRGTTVMLNNNLAFHNTKFQRAPLSDAWGADAGTTFEEVENGQKVFPLGPFIAVASDFGLDNWTFAAGMYGPSAVGKHDYPEYGPQSFMLTDMNILLAYYSLAAAWKFRDVFGVGATVQYVDMISMKYALVTDAAIAPTLDPVPTNPDVEPSTQLVTELELKDRASGTAILGLWYRPHQRVELGLASRIVPIYLKAKGGLTTDQETLLSDDVKAELPMVLPAKLRGGVRYIHDKGDREQPWFDVELGAYYENWSAIKSFDLSFEGLLSGMPLPDLSIKKNWRDTVSLRLGSDINVLPPYLTVRAGAFWENGAMRPNYSHLDFPSFMRGGISAGVSGGYKGIYLTVGYMHVFQEDRDVTEAGGKQFQERPLRPCPDGCGGASGVPANAGHFTSHFDLLGIGLDIRFRELLAGRRERKRKEREAATPDASPTPAPAATEPPATEPAPAAAAPDEPAAADDVDPDDTDTTSPDDDAVTEPAPASGDAAAADPAGDDASDPATDDPPADAA